jgi:FlaA1/EpsC-like NDP-sugar epimerase
MSARVQPDSPRTLDGANILITGGTGSLGQTLVRRILEGRLGQPNKIIVFSRCEAKQYAMKTQWSREEVATDDVFYDNFDELIQFWIGDVRHYPDVEQAVEGADIVFHAAAMKQVPTCEYFPAQAVATNVDGATNVVRAARRSPRTRTVLGISTDKACKPINVMGMTKAVQERILVEGNLHQDHCRIAAARYGNVISSRGSVIPLFRHQIERGGPVTVTLREMTRFLLSLNAAVDTIFAAFQHAEPGDIFVPQLQSARIVDIAASMIGERDIDIAFTGIRPGEKIHEILVSQEEAFRTTERAGHYVVQSQLPELAPREGNRPLSTEYSSADGVATGAELKALIAQADFVDVAMEATSGPAGSGLYG